MARCPNWTRKKRLGPGGGQTACRGTLTVALKVSVALPCKSMRNPMNPSETLRRNVLRRGVRLSAADVVAAYSSPLSRDIVCGTCGWSLARLQASCRARIRRHRGI